MWLSLGGFGVGSLYDLLMVWLLPFVIDWFVGGLFVCLLCSWLVVGVFGWFGWLGFGFGYLWCGWEFWLWCLFEFICLGLFVLCVC